MFKKAFKIFLTLLIIITVSLSYVIFTNNGTKFALNTVKNFMPGTLEIKINSGTLASSIDIENLSYKNNKTEIQLKSANIKLKLLEVLYGKLNIDYLNGKEVKIKIHDLPAIRMNDIHTNIILSRNTIYNNLQANIPLTTSDNANLKVILNGPWQSYKIIGSLELHEQIIHFKGSGSLDNININSEKKSPFKMNATIDWKDHWSWHLNVMGNIPSNILDDDINFDISSKGKINDFQINIKDLTMPLDEKNLKIKANVRAKDQDISGSATLFYGKNKATIKGNITDTIDIDGTINLSDLSELSSNISGDSVIKLEITGTPENAHIKARYNFNNISSQEINFSNATGNFEWGKNTFTVNNHIKSFGNEYFYFDDIIINSSGSASQHKINISCKDKESTLTGEIDGNLTQTEWLGKVNHLTYKNQEFVTKIEKPFNIEINSKKLIIKNICLKQGKRQICVDLSYSILHQDWDLKIKSDNFNILEIGNLNVKNLFSIEQGIVNGNIILKGIKNKITKKKAKIQITDLKLAIPKYNIKPILQDLSVNIDNDNLSLSGKYDNDKTKLDIIGEYKNNSGKLSLIAKNFTIINNPDLKFTTNAELELNLTGKLLEVIGNADIVNGDIKSSYSPYSIELPSDIKIKGEKDNENITDYFNISPSSKVEVDLGNKVYADIMNTTGRITGNLVFEHSDITNSIVTSGDLDIKNAVYRKYGKELNIKRGLLSYNKDNIYNPKIEISAVRTINNFEDNDILSSDKIEAGIMLQGRSSAPDIKLFAIPDKYDDEEIISLLIFGKVTSLSVEGETNKDNNSVRIGSQLVDSSGVLNDLGKSINLDQISLYDDESSSSDDNSSNAPLNGLKLAVSKRLSDKLSMTLIYGLYNDFYKIIGQYKIYENVSLKAYTSESSEGISLIYKFR